MLFRPLKHSDRVVNPNREVRQLSERLFNEVMVDYSQRWQRLKSEASSNGTSTLRNVLNDPWWSRESWRWDPFFSTNNVLKRAFPGIKIAAGLFAAYLAFDLIAGKKDDQH